MASNTSLSSPDGSKSQFLKEGSGYQLLVLEHREAAHRLGRSLAHRWNLQLPLDELTSAFDTALCEAAASYDPSRGASLLTWLFYFLKGELSRLAGDRNDPRSAFNPRTVRLDSDSDAEFHQHPLQLPSSEPCPERQSFTEDLREACRRALSELPELERVVILETYLAEEKVAKLARRLGYSRGHLSMVKHAGARRFRSLFGGRGDDFVWESSDTLPPKKAA